MALYDPSLALEEMRVQSELDSVTSLVKQGESLEAIEVECEDGQATLTFAFDCLDPIIIEVRTDPDEAGE